MSKTSKTQQRQHLLASESIGRLLLKLSAPAIIGMLVQAFYNIIDTVFIGHAVGTLGIGGLSIVFPLQIFIFAIMQMIGVGAAALISIALGTKELNKAEQVLGNALVMAVITGVILTILGITFSEPILKLFGATPSIMPYANDFMRVVLLGLPFISFASTTNNIVRAEGNAKTAMLVMIISALINTALDPIFIFWLHMGVKGAATATVIAQIFAAVYLYIYFARGKSALSFSKCNFRLKFNLCREIISIGFPSFIRVGVGSLSVIIVNNLLGFYGGDISIAAYGIINRVMQVSFMPIFGVAQGMQPILGFSYGAKKLARAREVVIKALIAGTIIAIIPFIIIFTGTKFVMMIFTTDPHLIAHSSHAILFVAATLPLLGLQVIGSSLFQSIGKAKPAFILSISRRVLFFFPLLLFMPKLFHLNGIWISFPIADCCSFFVTMAMFIPQMRKFRLQYKQ